MQSNAARALVAIASIAVIAVLFVVLSGGDDEEGTTTTGTGAGTTTTTTAPGGPAGDGGEQGRQVPEPQPEEPRRPPFETIRVSGGDQPVEELTYRQGERIRLAFDSEVDEEVHIHGYDRYVDLRARRTARDSFPAEIDGVFEIELHGSGAQIARLTVRP